MRSDTFGTWLAFRYAFAVIAIIVLHAGATEVSLLKAAGLAVGAIVALPLGPWVKFSRKRPVMVAMDLARFTAVISIPLAFALGRLGFAQLLIVSVIVAAADIAFRAASSTYLKSLVKADDLLIAQRALRVHHLDRHRHGTPARRRRHQPVRPGDRGGGRCHQLPVVGCKAFARSVGREPRQNCGERCPQAARPDLDGWRYILAHPALRPLLFNTIGVNGLIMATAPLVAVLMLGRLGFAPWQYGLAFGSPLCGRPDRLAAGPPARRAVRAAPGHARRRDAARVLGARAGLHAARRSPGSSLVMAVEFGLIVCCGVFNPVLATYRLEQTPPDRVARTLSAWSVSSKATHRGPDRPVGPAGQPHQPPHRDRGRRAAHAGHPAAAPPPRARDAARSGTGPQS